MIYLKIYLSDGRSLIFLDPEKAKEIKKKIVNAMDSGKQYIEIKGSNHTQMIILSNIAELEFYF